MDSYLRRALTRRAIGLLAIIALAAGLLIVVPTLAEAEPRGGTIIDGCCAAVGLPDPPTFGNTWLQLDSIADFSESGYGLFDRGGPEEQIISYESIDLSSNTLLDVGFTERHPSGDFPLGIFVEPLSEAQLPGPPPDPDSALAELQAYDDPAARKAAEVDLMSLTAQSHDVLVSEDFSYYLSEPAVGTNSLGEARAVFTTYEVDPEIGSWRPLSSFDGAPYVGHFAYAEITFPEPVCIALDPVIVPICTPSLRPQSTQVDWISFMGVPAEIDRVEYLAADYSWRVLMEDAPPVGITPMPQDIAFPVEIRLGVV